MARVWQVSLGFPNIWVDTSRWRIAPLLLLDSFWRSHLTAVTADRLDTGTWGYQYRNVQDSTGIFDASWLDLYRASLPCVEVCEKFLANLRNGVVNGHNDTRCNSNMKSHKIIWKYMKSYDILWTHILKSHENMTVCYNMLQWLWKWQPAAWCTEGLNAGLRIHRRMGHTQPGFQGGSGQYRQGLLQKAHASNIFKLGSQLKSKLFETYSGIAAKKPQHTETLRKQNMQILQDVTTHDPTDP